MAAQELQRRLHRISLTPNLMPAFATACLLFVKRPNTVAPIAACMSSLMGPARSGELSLTAADVLSACESVFANLNELTVATPEYPGFLDEVNALFACLL